MVGHTNTQANQLTFDNLLSSDKALVESIAKKLFDAISAEIDGDGEIWIVEQKKNKQIGRYLYMRELRKVDDNVALSQTVSQILVKIDESSARWQWSIIALNDHVMATGNEGTWLKAMEAAQKEMAKF